MKYKKIILIGMMGSGKTTVARELSKFLNIQLFDLDSFFENRFRMSIKDFFKKYSENVFRIQETKLLKEIMTNKQFVLSTGGGTILSKENRAIIFRDDNLTLFLSASPEIIYDRIKDDTMRPLLQVQNPKKEIENLINKRYKYYSMADKTISTDNKSIDEIIEEIKWIL